mmetsp:Transcript_10898/g.12299  ORF Transcript_10898/g.12299 Transcript_10898/m.12299 type:complete len:80 (+) Transcript_10898:48-287(+)
MTLFRFSITKKKNASEEEVEKSDSDVNESYTSEDTTMPPSPPNHRRIGRGGTGRGGRGRGNTERSRETELQRRVRRRQR